MGKNEETKTEEQEIRDVQETTESETIANETEKVEPVKTAEQVAQEKPKHFWQKKWFWAKAFLTVATVVGAAYAAYRVFNKDTDAPAELLNDIEFEPPVQTTPIATVDTTSEFQDIFEETVDTDEFDDFFDEVGIESEITKSRQFTQPFNRNSFIRNMGDNRYPSAEKIAEARAKGIELGEHQTLVRDTEVCSYLRDAV